MTTKLLPAQAGMIPTQLLSKADSQTAPRAGGDDPILGYDFTLNSLCSPRRRG